MKLPNFFILGAPKCGTTALSVYLREHPQVFMCTPKEPHYFAEEFPRYRIVERWDDYLGLFSGAESRHAAVGEASVFHLYSAVAIPRLLERIPRARLIVLLRNPVELARAMHSQVLLTRDETVTSFEEAWRLCDARRRGASVPPGCREVKILLYDQIAAIGAQLKRLLECAPRERVKWWFFDDFVRDPGRIYREVLQFLELADDGRKSFPQVNGRLRSRVQCLAQLTQKPPRAWVQAAAIGRRMLGVQYWGVLDFLRRINTVPARPPALPVELQAQMREHFAPDVRLLASITGRNLDHWLRAPAH